MLNTGKCYSVGGQRQVLQCSRTMISCDRSPVYSVCIHQPKPIWAWDTVNCEPVVHAVHIWGTNMPLRWQLMVN